MSERVQATPNPAASSAAQASDRAPDRAPGGAAPSASPTALSANPANALAIHEMMAMQRAQWERHQATWEPMTPAYARQSILWMMEEMGECIAIIKKQGDEAIMTDATVRQDFVEEMSDVLMYYCDALLRYGVTPDEIASAYRGKFERNMGRNYAQEYRPQAR